MSRRLWLPLILALVPAASGATPSASDISGSYRVHSGGMVVAIGACDTGTLCGRIIALGDLPATDSNNPTPALRDRGLCGMVVLTALEWQNGSWQGAFYEPRNGTDYQVSMMPFGDGAVRVSGYSGKPVLSRRMARPFELWERIAAPEELCGNAAAIS